MADELDADFEKADVILAEALERFQAEGVNQYVYGMSLLEIGLLALVRLDEDEAAIEQTVRDVLAKLRQSAPLQPRPRS